MDKCPYCLAETRPGDNFCLNCGNRLVPAAAASGPQAAPSVIGDATIAAPDNWGSPSAGIGPHGTPSSDAWSDAATVMGPDSGQIGYDNTALPTINAASEKIAQPARLTVRSEKGEMQDFTLDKPEMTIGRAQTSDIVLAKDKLTSRRHATLHYSNGIYSIRDEGSANSTFVNGQQIETMTPFRLKDGDLIGIGEYELIFRAPNSTLAAFEDMPTQLVGFPPMEVTARTQTDEGATAGENDPYRTRPADDEVMAALNSANGASAPVVETPAAAPTPPAATSYPTPTPVPAPVASSPVVASGSVASTPPPAAPVTPPAPPASPIPSVPAEAKVAVSSPSSSGANMNTSDGVTFNRLNSIVPPVLPDMTALMAAVSTLDGQVTALQEQLNATQEALHNHESEIAQTSNQLRMAVRRVSDRMDGTIADVARSREALAWADLLQLMEDVMNNPRDIEYVAKLGRKARELNKVFQMHQSVLNTMAECNSLLRSIIGDEH
jgi:pSer/pThr/pTyr-binding forkhead associated (FHA) protein